MPLKTMYSGAAFSPSTYLTQSINSSATRIYVNDITVFPEAPNLAVIGTSGIGEVIKYSVKGTNYLDGVERGLVGVAQEWQAGETIARNFTSIDYQNLIDNIEILNNEKAATEHASQHAADGNDPITASSIGAESKLKDLPSKGSIADNDAFAITDSAASHASKKTLWSTIKSTLKTYFDTLYNKYVHPTFTPQASGFYKIVVNEEGHVTDVVAVQKSDITSLGIPGQDTIYTHPSFTPKTFDFYKVEINSQGHVANATKVTKEDITNLGIPGEVRITNSTPTNLTKILKGNGTVIQEAVEGEDYMTSDNVDTKITAHNNDSGAHSAQLANKLDKSGGTMTGKLYAQANTDYTTYQVRNIALSTTAATPTGNGSLLGVYQ